MARWEPNARGRLQQAAMELYAQRGFEQTTVAEIAERAGLTERTFFRYFADKREVLFGGSEVVRDALVDAVAGAPESASPIEAVAAGLEAVAAILQERLELSRERRQIIAANAELRERELIKLASLAAALAETLRERGVEPQLASLTAEVGIAVFRAAFERWHEEGAKQELPQVMQESLRQLNGLAAARRPLQAEGRRPRLASR